MKEKIETVKFKNRNENNLFGIYHAPEKNNMTYGIIILSPGIKSRVAPHRLYIKMTREFIKLGFPVLRIDPIGLGDSEGEIDEKLTADVYCSIELGRLVDDTIDAMNWMQKKTGINNFILSGLCGGAITALLAAQKDERVHSILSLGMTCVLASSNVDPLKYITKSQMDSIRHKYLKKIMNKEAWGRFLTFQSDYRLIVKAMMQAFIKKEKDLNKDTNEKIKSKEETDLNPHFPEAFINFVSKKKILLIFSESDRLWWEFEEKFLRFYENDVNKYMDNIEIFIVKDANHVFSFKKWQEEMLDKATAWLKLCYDIS